LIKIRRNPEHSDNQSSSTSRDTHVLCTPYPVPARSRAPTPASNLFGASGSPSRLQPSVVIDRADSRVSSDRRRRWVQPRFARRGHGLYGVQRLAGERRAESGQGCGNSYGGFRMGKVTGRTRRSLRTFDALGRGRALHNGGTIFAGSKVCKRAPRRVRT
jgi:hypothetical protein